MKGEEEEEDDDSKPKSTTEITQPTNLPTHVELQPQTNYAGYQLMQVREAAGLVEFFILQPVICFSFFQSEEDTFILVVF